MFFIPDFKIILVSFCHYKKYKAKMIGKMKLKLILRFCVASLITDPTVCGGGLRVFYTKVKATRGVPNTSLCPVPTGAVN